MTTFLIYNQTICILKGYMLLNYKTDIADYILVYYQGHSEMVNHLALKEMLVVYILGFNGPS